MINYLSVHCSPEEVPAVVDWLDKRFSEMNEAENRPRIFNPNAKYYEYRCLQFILTIKPEKDSKGKDYYLLTICFENPFDLHPLSEITKLLKITGTGSLALGWVDKTFQDQYCSSGNYGGLGAPIDGYSSPEQVESLVHDMVAVSNKSRKGLETCFKALKETIREDLGIKDVKNSTVLSFLREALDHQRPLDSD